MPKYGLKLEFIWCEDMFSFSKRREMSCLAPWRIYVVLLPRVVFELAALERGLTVVLDISCNSSYFIVAMSETVFNIRLYCYAFCSVKDSCSGD